MPPDPYPLLGTVAIEAGVLTETELEDVLQKAAERGVALGEMLFKLGYVSRDRLLALLAEQYRTTVYDLSDWRPAPELLDVLPKEFVQEYQLLPVSVSGGRLVLAASGPFRTPLPDLISHVTNLTGCRTEVVICEPEALRRYIAEFFTGTETGGSLGEGAEGPITPGLAEFSSLVDEIRAEADAPATTDATARAELEEVLDRAFAALIEARGHEFLNPVLANTNSAAELLDKAKEYQHMGMLAEGLILAHRADRQLTTALRRANELQHAWGPLLQHVELLRTRLTQLDSENAADFAPQEMGRLREIREAMHDCIETKAVEQLRALVDEGQLLVERVAALSPRHNRRERLIESLTHVREVLARARRLGAQEVAPQAVQAAYQLLDDADVRARENAWDLVQDALAQALAHAQAAEAQAMEYAEQRKQARTALRALCDEVDASLSELTEHPAVQSILPGVLSALRQLTAGRLAADGEGDAEPHVETLTGLRDNMLPQLRQDADDAHAQWADLGWAIEAAAAATHDGIHGSLTGQASTAAAQTADDLVAFFRALNDRNLSSAQAVVQGAEQRLRDFWDTSGRLREERRHLEGRLAEATAALAAVVARLPDDSMQQTVDRVRGDLDRAGTALAEENFGDATALLDAVEHTIATQITPAAAGGDAARQEVLNRTFTLGIALADLAAEEAPALAPASYPTLLEAAERAMHAARDGDLAAAETALSQCADAQRAVRADMDAALTARAEALTRRLAELDTTLRRTVEAAAGHGAPESLEDAYFELNSARTLLDEHVDRIPSGIAARIETHIRAAEVTVELVAAAGAHSRQRLEGVLEQLHEDVTALDGTLDGLLAQPDLGLDHPGLQDATDLLAEAHSAHGRGDAAQGFALVRQAERILEDVRADRQRAGERRKELDEFFSGTLPAHLAALDGAVLERVAPDAWAELRTLPPAAAEAQGANDIATLADLHARATALVADCTNRERADRSRRLAATHEAQAAAEAALRLAELLRAQEQSPDLFAAATQLRAAGDNAARICAWDDAVAHYRAAATRAAQAQEAALEAGRDAHAAYGDLLRAAADHLARGDVAAARDALQAAQAAADRATPPQPDTGGLAAVANLDELQNFQPL